MDCSHYTCKVHSRHIPSGFNKRSHFDAHCHQWNHLSRWFQCTFASQIWLRTWSHYMINTCCIMLNIIEEAQRKLAILNRWKLLFSWNSYHYWWLHTSLLSHVRTAMAGVDWTACRNTHQCQKQTSSPMFTILKPRLGCQLQLLYVTSHTIITYNNYCHPACTKDHNGEGLLCSVLTYWVL